MPRFHRSLCALALVLAAGCATVAPRNEDPWAAYDRAIKAAQYPVQEHVSRSLVPILRTNPDLRWNDDLVLMVTWTRRFHYDGKVGAPYQVPAGVDLWVTAAPYLQRACRAWDLPAGQLSLRLSQMLGLPPPPEKGGDDSFVQMWVDPKTLFRPCPDPEIGDRECQVSLAGGPVDRSGACPWPADQLSGAFVQVSGNHLGWMCKNWKSSYTGDPKTSYPWTALGYTYDWGAPHHPQGQSEFVVLPGTTVWIEGIFTTAQYCGGGDGGGGG